MAMVSKSRNMLEGLESFKWLSKRRSVFQDEQEIEELESSASAALPQLSPIANLVIRRCSKFVL